MRIHGADGHPSSGAIKFKLPCGRGAYVKDVLYENITASDVASGIMLAGGSASCSINGTTVVSNVTIRNVHAQNIAGPAFAIDGYSVEGRPSSYAPFSITLQNVTMQTFAQLGTCSHATVRSSDVTPAVPTKDASCVVSSDELVQFHYDDSDATWDLSPVTLRGTSSTQFSMYTSPPDLAGLEAMIAAMRHHGLGRAFDPVGVPLSQLNATVVDVLAAANFSYVSFGGGADCQVPDGDTPGSFLTPQVLAALERLNSTTTTAAVQFGEYGYYFHCLQKDPAWYHVVYKTTAAFARHQHDITPPGLMGFRSMPKSHAEAYTAVAAYVEERRQAFKGWMFAYLTGHAHYSEMYAARWGAGMISMEVGADVGSSQSKIAFARGSSRRNRIPWSLQVSPWYISSCTTHGPVRNSGGTWTGSAAGHSMSFVRRLLLQGWFAGAALLTPENSGNSFFDRQPAAGDMGTLSPHGLMGAAVNRFIGSHDRGVPYIPVLTVIDEHAGYSRIPCNWSGVSWGIFAQNAEANETAHLDATVPADILVHLFEEQIYPSANRGPEPEAAQLRPTPFGELIDVGLSDTPAQVLAAYQTILLAGGDIDFARQSPGGATLASELARALSLSPDLKLLLQPYHVAALEDLGGFVALNATGRVEILTGQGVAITDERLGQLRDELLPFTVTSNVSVQWQVNRQDGGGWVVTVINNEGVFKTPNTTETFDYSKTSAVELVPRFHFAQGVWEWGLDADKQLRGPGPAGTPVHTVLPPGSTTFLQFKSDDTQTVANGVQSDDTLRLVSGLSPRTTRQSAIRRSCRSAPTRRCIVAKGSGATSVAPVLDATTPAATRTGLATTAGRATRSTSLACATG